MISLGQRALIFFSLWIIAGVVWAVFADLSVEAGESQLTARCQMVYLAPFMAAQGLAFVIVPGGYNAWPNRQNWEEASAIFFICVFVAHGTITLTRRGKNQFLTWTAIQITLLVASIVSVLYYFHWDALHMHA